MDINPNALVLWALLGIIGYLIGGTQACLIGIAGGLAISLLLSLLSRN